MIKVVIDDDEIRVNGHANDKQHPRCINSIRACEAITVLTQTLVRSVSALSSTEPEYELDYGKFIFKTTGLTDVSRILVDSFIVGVKMAQTAYKDYITVIDNKSRHV
jgi:uncharacterized protein YsxB (DUF464 family)